MYQDWKNSVEQSLNTKGKSFDHLISKTADVQVEPLYTNRNEFYNFDTSISLLVAEYNKLFINDISAFNLTKSLSHSIENKTLFLNPDLKNKIPELSQSNNELYLFQDPFLGIETKDMSIDLKDEKTCRIYPECKKSIVIDMALLQNAGADSSHQLGYALAKINDIVEVYGAEVLEHIFIKVAVGSHYFLEIAKIRALRVVWEHYNTQLGSDFKSFIYTGSSLRNKSFIDHENNLIRTTLEASAALCANSDAVFINSYQFWEDMDLSQEIAYKQLLVLAEESYLTKFNDPLSGAYYIEELTKNLAENAWEIFVEIENNGGYIKNILNNNIPNNIRQIADNEQEKFNNKEITLIGINKYPPTSIEKINIPKQDKSGRINPTRLSEKIELN